MRALGVMADWDAEDGVYRTMGESFIRTARASRETG